MSKDLDDPRLAKGRLNLYQRLADIAGTLHVDKNGQMTEAGRYSFIKHEDLIEALKSILQTNGIVILPEEVEMIAATEYKTARGALGRHVRIKVVYRIVDAWDPSVSFTVEALGEAADTQDKGTQKAGTSAEKYLYMRLLKITEGGQDSDAIAVEEGVVAETAPRPAPGSQPIPQGNGASSVDLDRLKVLASSMATPWAEPVLKARLERFGFDVVRADLIKAGATGEIQASAPIPPPPPPAPAEVAA